MSSPGKNEKSYRTIDWRFSEASGERSKPEILVKSRIIHSKNKIEIKKGFSAIQ